MSNVPRELHDDIPTFEKRPSSSDHGPIDWTGLTSVRTAKSALEVATIVGLALAIFFGLEAVLRWTDTPTYVFPKPMDVVQVLWNEFGPVFAHHLWVTMYEFLAGYAIGAAIGVSCEPRPARSVVRMPYISPTMVGRDSVISRYWPCRLVTR